MVYKTGTTLRFTEEDLRHIETIMMAQGFKTKVRAVRLSIRMAANTLVRGGQL